MTNSSNHDLQWRHPFARDLNALHVYPKYYLDDLQTIL